MLPFTHDQFVAVFAAYNAAVWPAQAIAWALGLAVISLVFVRRAGAGRVIAALLAAMWLWTGIAYHALFFAPLNPAAWGFAALFVAQGFALLGVARAKDPPRFVFEPTLRGFAGLLFATYALAFYPLIGLAAGQPPVEMPWFGLTPCPVTLFTLGLLLLRTDRTPWALLAIPVLWSLIGGTAAFLLAVPQDWPLLFGGGLALLVLRSTRRGHGTSAS